MGPEAKLQAKCVSYARRNKWWAAKLESPGMNGVPDFMFIRDGHMLFVEFKASGKKPTPLQLHIHQEMRLHGATVVVIDDFDEFRAIFM